jgi:serine/threonine protein phosphatase 1
VHSVEAHADHWSITKRQWQLPVLKTKPWHDFTWSELAAAIARFSSAPDTTTRSWLEAVEKWAADLQSSFPALVEAAHRLANDLSTNELRQHPAAQYLFQARNGRLDQTSLARQCSTPRRTIDLAAALGLVVPKLPD